jgi:hypothetical protein
VHQTWDEFPDFSESVIQKRRNGRCAKIGGTNIMRKARILRKTQGNGRLPIYKSYVFTTKDPAIDEFRSLVEKHFGARVSYKHLAEIKADGGPSIGAMQGWFFGATKRPQNPTLEAAGRAIGYRRQWVRMGKS